MSLVLKLNEDNFNISNGMNLAYVTSSTSGVYKFKCLLEVTYSLNSQISKTITFTQSELTSQYFLFNLTEVYRTIVTPMITASALSQPPVGINPNQQWSIHHLPAFLYNATRLFSQGIVGTLSPNLSFRGNANVLNLKFYEYYSTTATGVPVKDENTEVEETIFLMYGRGNADEGVVIDFNDYKATGNTKRFLNSNYKPRINNTDPVIVEIGKNDYHTLSFLNRCEINTSASPYKVSVEYFNSSGTSLGTLTALNTNTSGGKEPNANIVDEFFHITFGCGLENLQKINISDAPYEGTLPDSVTGGRDAIAYYEVKLTDLSNADASSTYKFIVQDYCSRYEQKRISWLNRFGVWEYMTLNKEVEENLEVERQTITKPLLSQASALVPFLPGNDYMNSAYPLNVAKQGEMVSQMYAKEKLKLFTDNLTQDYQVEMIKDMMMSEQVHLIDGDNAVALVLENSNMKLKNKKETGLFQYELTFRYANPKHRL